MIIVMNGKTDDADVEKVMQKLREMGHKVHISRGRKTDYLGSNRGCGKFIFCFFLCL